MLVSGARRFFAVGLLTGLAACAAPEGADIYDPLEPLNRSVHSVNKEFDKAAFGPASDAYADVVPEAARKGINNFAANLGGPGDVLNDLLQFRIEDALHNTVRFAVNTTVGLGGLFDPATPMGIEARPSDFGETLHVWGFAEGPYLELPVLGPSTTRDTIGFAVDLALNPIQHVLPEEATWLMLGAEVATRLDDRHTFASTFDSVLYESADSYAQSRLFYLESRRFELRGDKADETDDIYDLYEEAFE